MKVANVKRHRIPSILGLSLDFAQFATAHDIGSTAGTGYPHYDFSVKPPERTFVQSVIKFDAVPSFTRAEFTDAAARSQSASTLGGWRVGVCPSAFFALRA